MNSNKHIALFLPSLNGGGAERHAVNLVNAMVALETKVDLVVATKLGELNNLLDKRVKTIELDCLSVSRSVFKLASYLRKERPDALYSLLDHANFAAWLALKLVKSTIKLIPSVHSVLSSESSRAKSIKEKFLFFTIKNLYRFFPVIISVSKGSRRDVIAFTKISPDRVKVIYNAILYSDMYRLAQEPVSHPWFQDENIPLLVAAGRLSPEKNFSLLIDAMSLVCQQKKVRLVIFGRGPLHDILQKKIDQLNLSDKISLFGFDPNIYKYLKHCDLFVLSSLSESLCCVLVEALALAPDVVATNCQFGPSEVLCDGRYGHLVENNNANALAKGILQALDKDKQFENKEVGLKRFDATVVAKQYLSLIDDA